jgi:hypothetical protein
MSDRSQPAATDYMAEIDRAVEGVISCMRKDGAPAANILRAAHPWDTQKVTALLHRDDGEEVPLVGHCKCYGWGATSVLHLAVLHPWHKKMLFQGLTK